MYYALASDSPRFNTLKTFARSTPHIHTFSHIIIVHILQFLLNTQRKCEQYWNEQLDKPYDAGRSFTVVTTGYRGFADYVVRDMTLMRVSLSKNMQSPKHSIQPGINTVMHYNDVL